LDKKLKGSAKKNGYPNNELADASGVKRTTIDRIEKGVSKEPTSGNLSAIAKAFGMSFIELVRDTNMAVYEKPTETLTPWEMVREGFRQMDEDRKRREAEQKKNNAKSTG